MEVFVWNMAISFQLLFIIISGVIFIYLGEKSFKYYALYNLCLLIYVLSRNDYNYYGFENLVGGFIGRHNSEVFTRILCFYIQIIFYSFYTIFALRFLDLDQHIRKYFNTVILILRSLTALFLLVGIICYLLKDAELFVTFYMLIFLPVMLSLFLITVIRALKHSGRHKDYFLFGVCAYVFCALVAFAGTFIPSLKMKNPISFFYVGIAFETIFFSLGLANKIKLINDEKNRVRNLVTKHKHQQKVSKLKGLLEGEEKERKRIAQELHDGIAGDLAAIKFNLAYLSQEIHNPKSSEVLKELSHIAEKSGLQLREISHNLSPSSLTNDGLFAAVENYCKKMANIYKIKIDVTCTGKRFELTKSSEMHIYRIIQELVNNIIKHSEATFAQVEIVNEDPIFTFSVKDNGMGFSAAEVPKGIGLRNIDSRVRFLGADLQRISDINGTSYKIIVNARNIHKL